MTVRDEMLRVPKVHGAETTAADLHELFADAHVHAALIVDGSRLASVVERADLVGCGSPTQPATEIGKLTGRTVLAGADPETTRHAMLAAGQRRLAVVDCEGTLLGLLALKRSGRGFCSDSDVAARRTEQLQMERAR